MYKNVILVGNIVVIHFSASFLSNFDSIVALVAFIVKRVWKKYTYFFVHYHDLLFLLIINVLQYLKKYDKIFSAHKRRYK